MKLYEHKETTPLSFYKFFMYVYLPIGMAGGLYSLIAYAFIGNLYSFYEGWYRGILIAQGIFILTLYVFMFYGMLKWKKYTLALFIVLLVFCCVSSVFTVVYIFTHSIIPMDYFSIPDYQMPLYFSSMMESMTRVITIVVSVINVGLYTLMFLYFYKRRLLFDGVPYKIPPKYAQPYPPYPPQQPYPPQYPYPPQQYYAPQQPYPPQYYQPPQPHLPRFYQYSDQCCTYCGRPRITNEYRFCPNCGKEYPNQ